MIVLPYNTFIYNYNTLIRSRRKIEAIHVIKKSKQDALVFTETSLFAEFLIYLKDVTDFANRHLTWCLWY